MALETNKELLAQSIKRRRGGIRAVKGRSSVEIRMEKRLAFLKLGKLIDSYSSKPGHLQLASGCAYTPDFIVTPHRDSVIYIETKGGWVMEDSRIKFKFAAATHPDSWFIWSQWKNNVWLHELWRGNRKIKRNDWPTELRKMGVLEL